MSPRSRRILIVIFLIVLAIIALLFVRCRQPKPVVASAPAATAVTVSTTPAATPSPAPAPTSELLTPATVDAPAEIAAGKSFAVKWTGPNNPRDYVTIVARGAADAVYGTYVETKTGSPMELTAPIEPGAYEVRYVTARSQTVLGRTSVNVTATSATLLATDEAGLGTSVSVTWTGPDNLRDYITVVPKGTPDGQYGNYTDTAKGSPLSITLPVEAGDAELRYMTGQGSRVLARRPLRILTPEVGLSAPASVVAGTVFKLSWTGPSNPNDYITIVPRGEPDGQYKNYTPTAKGSPLALTALIAPGEAELRYMTGTGSRVLARRPIEIVPATITLDAPAETVAGAPVAIQWTGPNNAADYLTIVPRSAADGKYVRYADTSKGTPLLVESPIDPGDMEIRYMSGQGAKVLARRPLRTIAPRITLQGPPQASAGGPISIVWTGPNNPGDYLTVVPKAAKDGVTHATIPAARGSPATVRAPDTPGPAEIRYISGQENRVLARAELELQPAKK